MRKFWFCLSILILFAGCIGKKSGKPLIVTSIPVWKSIAQYIGGRDFEYYSILKGGESPHGYEPKPSDIAKLNRANLVIIHGLGMDNWAVKGASKLPLFNIGEVLSRKWSALRESPGYHIWADPEMMEDVYYEIARKLSEFNPQKRLYYEKRAGDYAAVTKQITDKIKDCVTKLRNPKVIAYHPIWEPFFKAVGIKCISYIVNNPEEEVTPRRFKELIDIGKRENIKLVIGETITSDQIPKRLADEINARLLILDPLPEGDYVSALSMWGRKLCESINTD